MVVMMRLQRFGQKHRPFYRIVAAYKKSPRNGKFLEILGTYDPIPDREGQKHITLNVERIKKRIMHGAIPSDVVATLLGRAGLTPAWPHRLPRSAIIEAMASDAAQGEESLTAEQLEGDLAEGEVAVSDTDEVAETPDTR